MFKDGVEIICLRFAGGPHAGEKWVPLPEMLEECKAKEWPPPEELKQMGGKYVRVKVSTLTAEEANHPNIVRGVEYRWEEEDKTPKQLKVV